MFISKRRYMLELLKNYINFNLFLSKNKTLEIEFGVGSKGPADWDVFIFAIEYTVRTDHAGFRFQFCLWKLVDIMINIRDNRHWNYSKGRWNTEEEYYPKDSKDDVECSE